MVSRWKGSANPQMIQRQEPGPARAPLLGRRQSFRERGCPQSRHRRLAGSYVAIARELLGGDSTRVWDSICNLAASSLHQDYVVTIRSEEAGCKRASSPSTDRKVLARLAVTMLIPRSVVLFLPALSGSRRIWSDWAGNDSGRAAEGQHLQIRSRSAEVDCSS